MKHFPYFIDELKTLAPYMAFDFENYLSFLNDMAHSKMSLDPGFSFASNVNFFTNLAKATVGNSPFEKEKPKFSLHFSQREVLDDNDYENLKKQFTKTMNPNSRNGILSKDYKEIETFKWVNLNGITFSAADSGKDSKRCLRKNCYIYEVDSHGNYSFYLIKRILKVYHNDDIEVWSQVEKFVNKGTLCDNGLDPVLELGNETMIISLDEKKFRKMGFLKEDNVYYPILA